MPGRLVGDPSPRAPESLVPSRSAVPGFVRRFVELEAAGGILVMAMTVLALAAANSPLQSGYRGLFDEHARRVVDEGLMALFFLVVGLEIKREIVDGELADRKVAALPVAAAMGGMIAPAALYLWLGHGHGAARGWGIPMATDIAFALAVLSLTASRAPSTLKLILLTLAVVDDVGAIVVIAVFYGHDVRWGALAGVIALVALYAGLQRTRAPWVLLAVVAVGAWLAADRSGVHPTIAGVAIGLATPAAAAQAVEDRLHPWTTFVVLPLFALANAGVTFRHDLLATTPAATVAVAVAVALVVGKFGGILSGAWLAVRLGLGTLPGDVRWSHVAGLAALGGVGFTVSLFVTTLAFPPGGVRADAARAAILGGSVLAALAGTAILRWAPGPERGGGG